mmetsp:Transcript_67279/g.132714  ORF Transcript_67279/g.132714 Transcript_67279/m.132714 type:complete len:407 (-) Transcript_67279:80-1300(-)
MSAVKIRTILLLLSVARYCRAQCGNKHKAMCTTQVSPLLQVEDVVEAKAYYNNERALDEEAEQDGVAEDGEDESSPKPMMKTIVREYFATKRQDLTWDDADAACAAEKEGGKLAIVTNRDERKKIYRTWRKGRDDWAPKNRSKDCDRPWSSTRKTPRCWGEDEYTQWIGLHRKKKFRDGASPDKNFNNMWEWNDGTEAKYSDWINIRRWYPKHHCGAYHVMGRGPYKPFRGWWAFDCKDKHPALCMTTSEKMIEVPEYEIKKASYQINNEKLTWQEARTACKARGGDLASITSKQENTHVRRLIPGKGGKYWIGLNDIEKEGEFVLADGRVATYLPWGTMAIGAKGGTGNKAWFRRKATKRKALENAKYEGGKLTDCVYLKANNKNAKWGDGVCNWKMASLCKIMK